MAKKWSPSNLVYVMEILQEAFKLPQRNKKTFFFIFLFTIISHSLLSFANIFSIKSLSTKIAPNANALSLQSTDPEIQSHHLKGIFVIFFVDMMFLFFEGCVSLFSTMATIHASSMSYLRKEKDLTLKKLCLKIKKIWFKPIITCFNFSIINAGYIAIAVFFLIVGIAVSGEASFIVKSAVGVVVMVPAIVFYVSLVLVWMLSLVVSVLEDSCYGIEALGKAKKLVKGRKVAGMVLTCILIVVFGASFVVPMINYYLPPNIGGFMLMVTMDFAILMSGMVYTVFFLERKQSYGERVAVEEDSRDNKLLEVLEVEGIGINRRKTCTSSQTGAMGLDFLHTTNKTSFI